jgi:hypothetical protein
MLEATAPGTDDVETIATIKSQLHAAVDNRLTDLATSPLVRLAHFFDPTQIRDSLRLNEEGMLSAQAHADLSDTTDMLGTYVTDSMRRVRDGSPRANDGSLPSMVAQLLAPYSGWASLPLAKAISDYIELDKTDAEDPLQWWRKQAGTLAPLDAIARWFLCIPATSAESERTFSLAGWLVSSTRARLSGSRVNDLVLLRRYLSRKEEPPPTSAGVEPSNSQGSDEGDQMADFIDEGILTVSGDGVLVPSCDPTLLNARQTDDASEQSAPQ